MKIKVRNKDEMLKLKSIKLGFNGKISDDFYTKWKSTNKVRLRLFVELLISSIIFFGSIFLLFTVDSILIFICYTAVAVIMGIVMFTILKVWVEIYEIGKERIKVYNSKKH